MSVYVEIKDPKKDVDQKIKARKKTKVFGRGMIVLGIIFVIISTFLRLEMETYDSVKIVRNYKDVKTSDANYMEFEKGFLRYRRDGIGYIDGQGVEKWNRSYQFKNPMVVTNGSAGAVADKGGNDIIIFNAKQSQGQIHTNFPVEKLAVSEGGIVGALLNNGAKPQIVCYDVDGNILIEHQSTINGKGYPIGMSLSPNGAILQVSYLCVEDGVQATRICYYNFGPEGNQEENFLVKEDIYKNEVIPTTMFLDNSNSVLISDSSIIFYKGDKKPKKTKRVKLGAEVSSFFYDDSNLGFFLKNKSGMGKELRIYDMTGELKVSKVIDEKPGKIKMSGGNVIVTSGKRCDIYTTLGIHLFSGEMNQEILEIRPLPGVNKFLMVGTDGIYEIRLVK